MRRVECPLQPRRRQRHRVQFAVGDHHAGYLIAFAGFAGPLSRPPVVERDGHRQPLGRAMLPRGAAASRSAETAIEAGGGESPATPGRLGRSVKRLERSAERWPVPPSHQCKSIRPRWAAPATGEAVSRNGPAQLMTTCAAGESLPQSARFVNGGNPRERPLRQPGQIPSDREHFQARGHGLRRPRNAPCARPAPKTAIAA